jgi:ABC-2 type transport system permease protein
MTTTTLTAPVPMSTAGVHTRPGLARLVAVELRKVLDTRAGAWLQVATVVLTVAAVVASLASGGAGDHTFVALLDVGLLPAAVLLPVAGVLLVTSEWSQRTGMITFALVPVRSRVLVAKLLASCLVAVGMLAVSLAVVALGALAASGGTDGAWADAVPLAGQSAVYLVAGMVTGVAFGAVVLNSNAAVVALFALPIAWTAVATLPFLTGAAPWLDTRLALDPLHQEVVSATGWAHVASALVLWMLLPLALGTWRITRREIAL